MLEIADMSNCVSQALRVAGCDVVTVRECSLPGPADLMVEWKNDLFITFHVWIELKVTAPLREQQRTFLEARWNRYKNAYLLHYNRHGKYVLYPGSRPLVRFADLWSNSNFEGNTRSFLKTIEDIIK